MKFNSHSNGSKRFTLDGLVVLLVKYIVYSMCFYLNVAGFTYFWKEIFLSEDLAGRIFWIVLPLLVVAMVLVGQTVLKFIEKICQRVK